MDNRTLVQKSQLSDRSPLFDRQAFERLDEGEDRAFYERDRFVNHLDATALETVKCLVGGLVVERDPVILDLMAGWDSHIPDDIVPAQVVGLGLNENELRQNSALDRFVIHDLNRDATLPFPSGLFDVVLNTVSVDYLVRPVEVFQEVGRVLKPGGLFLVIFSNRMFPQKAVKVWREADEGERVILVEEMFKAAGVFEEPAFYVCKGRPRPEGDKYEGVLPTSDPVYALYAERKGGPAADRPVRKAPPSTYGPPADPEVLERKKKAVKRTLRCPHCDERLRKWEVPDNPFCQTWDNEYMYICFNDACPYYVRGWDRMTRDTHQSLSYRFMYNPDRDCCQPIPVPSSRALRDGIMD